MPRKENPENLKKTNPISSSLLSRTLLSWYQSQKILYPWRTFWEERRDPYVVWLSEIMLQQTTITTVLPVYTRFLERYPTINSLQFIADEELKQAVQGLGYYRRFFLFKKGVETVLSLQRWPSDFQEWKSIPGVGDYTAAAIASITLGNVVPSVDGNVIRVISRLFGFSLPSDSKNLRQQVFDAALSIMDRDHPGDFNQAMMELGQKVCRPTSPLCSSCVVAKHCKAYQLGCTEKFPLPKTQKTAFTPLELHLVIFHCKNHVALCPRNRSSTVLKGTNGFFTSESPLDDVEKMGSFSHSITRYKITAHVYASSLKPRHVSEWISFDDVESKLIAALDLKAWSIFRKSLKECLWD